MEKASLFKNNQSQAVRLPKAAAFPDEVKQVEIIVQGQARILSPAGESWDAWFDGEQASEDFLDQRDQPAGQAREVF